MTLLNTLIKWWNETPEGEIYPNNFGVYTLLMLIVGTTITVLGLMWLIDHVRII